MAGKTGSRSKRAADSAVSPAVPISPGVAAVHATMRMGDGLTNVLTGMGGGRRNSDEWLYSPLDDGQLMNAYQSDWMVRKAVDVVAKDMTQQWRRWQLEPEQITAIERTEKRLGIRQKVRQALTWARLFGGGAIIVGDGTRNTRTPLNVDTVKADGIKYAVAVPRTKLTVNGELNWNPAAENYGLPEYFDLQIGNGPQVQVHWSRCIIFRGNPYPDPMQTADPWGDSVIQAIRAALADAAIATNSGARLVEEARVDVLIMENLASHLQSTETEAALVKRMQLVAMGKSNFKTLLMGGGEQYDSKTINLANIDSVTTMFLQIVSGAVDIPMTRFLAQSPAGQNSTGESDLRNYAIKINADQENDLGPCLERLDQIVLRCSGIDPEDAWYEWNPIWSQSPKEAAETNKLNSEADEKYANLGMVPTKPLGDAIMNRMIENGLYPGFEESRNEATAAELAELRPEAAPIPVDPNNEAKLATQEKLAKAKPPAGAPPAKAKSTKPKSRKK